MFVGVPYLHPNATGVFDERKFHGNIIQVCKRSRRLVCQTGRECVSVAVVAGLDVRFGQFASRQVELADPIYVLPDVVPCVRIDAVRNTDFVFAFELNALRQLRYVPSGGDVRR